MTWDLDDLLKLKVLWQRTVCDLEDHPELVAGGPPTTFEPIEAPSPLSGDQRYFGHVHFHFERYDLPDLEKWKLLMAFLHHGVVAWSEVGGGWLYFSGGRKGQPTVAAATEEMRRECPALPGDWERLAECRP